MEIYGVSCSSPHQFRDPYHSEFAMNASEIRFSEAEYSFMNHGDRRSQRIMKGLFKQLDEKGHKMVKKLLEKGVPVEIILRETLHDFRGKHSSDILEKLAKKRKKEGFTSTDRGDVVQEESEHKLEWFKVKAVNTIGSGIVKEEGGTTLDERPANG